MFVPLLTCMIGIDSSLCSAPLDPSHPMHLFRSLSCPFCARLKCHFPLWTNRVQNDSYVILRIYIWYFDFEMLAGLQKKNHQQQVTDQSIRSLCSEAAGTAIRSTARNGTMKCQTSGTTLLFPGRNRMISMISSWCWNVKCLMVKSNILMVKIGILDGEQQKKNDR